MKIIVLAGCVVACMAVSCDLFEVKQTRQDEVAVADSTLSVDTPLNSDTVMTRDSFPDDGTQNKDTALLPPSQTIHTGNVNPNDVISFAETLKGIPYQYASTDPKVGFDCSGFITYVFNHFKIAVPRSSIDFTNVGKTIPVDSAKRGDIILFTGTDSTEKFVGHMGLITENNGKELQFIHSTSGKAYGVTITPLNDYYKSRFVKTIRIFPQNDG
jgi:cell wall-associated NlpC family hydrolase